MAKDLESLSDERPDRQCCRRNSMTSSRVVSVGSGGCVVAAAAAAVAAAAAAAAVVAAAAAAAAAAVRTVLLNGRQRSGMMQKMLMMRFLLVLQGVDGILMEILNDHRENGHLDDSMIYRETLNNAEDRDERATIIRRDDYVASMKLRAYSVRLPKCELITTYRHIDRTSPGYNKHCPRGSRR